MSEAGSVNEIVKRLRQGLTRFGYSACLITNLPRPEHERWQQHILINEWPRQWYERYVNAGHYRNDPCALISRSTEVPFLWEEVAKRHLCKASRRVMEEAGDFGLRQGLCVPIGLGTGNPAVVTMAGEEIGLSPIARCTAHALARHAHSAARRLIARTSPRFAPLSPREREVLRWASLGKTAWEISNILSISESTVNTHYRNSRCKLDTTNVVHTVAEALRRGEIEL
ncbi:autoinducer binding domain-containing protein [Aminobacter aganoensis]|uniref:LuxR family quorum sensing-dependent transcriptional regulator n=1 Tax=Aminobacter aganoensis TaxID=83264 RepID=A0A7X0FCB9_9HYPH|nr:MULTISPECIES: LuxR family transcriptional regulator [Aminobacter]MBB6357085.1 LuxR family quorum sensing-dependent transcriptional regulator [Aminobacter aganoensis]